MGFSTEELTVKTSDGLNVTVMEQFSFTRPDGDVIIVPAGATSDGASTPRVMWATLPPFGTYWKAAVLHDYLYREANLLPKEDCDTIFKEALESLGVCDINLVRLYQGVNLFGGEAFKDDREHDA